VKLILHNVHDSLICIGRPCPIHNRTEHHMSHWPIHWRGDRGILERLCEHGIGHPDPDQFQYWEETGQEWQSVHGCDGCCAP
jgi:hypothetical protein